jgi:hypothetical protein
VSTPFENRPGAQATYAAMRGESQREPDVTDMLGAHQNRIEDLDRRLTALEAAGQAGDEQEGGSDGE